MPTSDPLRQQLVSFLEKSEAHATTDEAVAGLAPALQGKRPAGLPHSPWEILEHIRITQHDVLDFCVNPNYKELSWPTDYWPPSPAPPKPDAWEQSVEKLRADRAALCALAENSSIDLFARIPHGEGQTYIRELLLVADHNSYHVGQLILVRRSLGAWPPAQ